MPILSYTIFIVYLYYVLLVDKVTLKCINRLIEYRLCRQPNFKSLGNARYVVQSSWLRLLNYCNEKVDNNNRLDSLVCDKLFVY